MTPAQMTEMAEKEYPYPDNKGFGSERIDLNTLSIEFTKRERSAYIKGLQYVPPQAVDLKALDKEITELLASETDESLKQWMLTKLKETPVTPQVQQQNKQLYDFVCKAWSLIYGEYRNRQEKPSPDNECNTYANELHDIALKIMNDYQSAPHPPTPPLQLKEDWISVDRIIGVFIEYEESGKRSVGTGCNFEKYILPNAYEAIAEKIKLLLPTPPADTTKKEGEV